jgi:hypothetical protein
MHFFVHMKCQNVRLTFDLFILKFEVFNHHFGYTLHLHIKIRVMESCNQNVVTERTIILILFPHYIQAITSK